MEDEQLLRYSRHIFLEEIGIVAQEKLLSSTVLIVGLGGLGTPAALYLASAGVGRLILVDYDFVDLTNIQRQILYTSDQVGRLKTESARDALLKINPNIRVEIFSERLADVNLTDSFPKAQVVLDCTDNFPSRYLINQTCMKLGIPLVSAGAIEFKGQLTVCDPRSDISPCYECIFPDHGTEFIMQCDSTVVEHSTACATMGVFSPVTGVIGILQASEALKILGEFSTSSIGKLFLLDFHSMTFRDKKIPRNVECPACHSLIRNNG